jgi:hypothetical protein
VAAGVLGSEKAVVAVADVRTGQERAPQLAAEKYGAMRCGPRAHVDRTWRGRTGRAARYAVTCAGLAGPAATGVRRHYRQVGPLGAVTVNGSMRQAAVGDPSTATGP